MKKRISPEELFVYADKTLNVLCNHVDSYNARNSRPYYPLNDGWGLTFLSSGQPFFVNTIDRNITPWLIMGGHWENNVDQVMMEYVIPGMRVADIGANMGYYTVKLGTKIGAGGRLWAFEPNPEVNAHCLENIKINNLSGVVSLHNIALGDEVGTATLTRSNSNMASANLVGDQDADFSVEVPVDTLDNVLGSAQEVDFIKLDAEGYEPKILQGAKSILGRSASCAIMIELSLDRWERLIPLEQLLPLCGGMDKDIYAVTDDGYLEHFVPGEIASFLKTRPFHENYFLIGSGNLIERNCARLIRRPKNV